MARYDGGMVELVAGLPHDVWLVNEPEVETDLNTTYNIVHSLTEVFPAVGNHDTAPINLFPPSDSSFNGTNQWAYNTLSAGILRVVDVLHLSQSN